MMESCFGEKPEREGPVVVDDIKRDLLEEFNALPAQEVVQTENLQVFLRVRPFTKAERESRDSQQHVIQECVSIEGPDTVVLRAPRTCQSKSLPQTAQRFTFTQVFDPEASQRKVFEGSVRGLVRDVLIGGNCLVFTYGVTNAGKTFTFLGPEHDSGLLPRSLSVIFNSIEGRVYPRSDLKPQRCRDFTRLTTEQQAAESSSKRSLLRLLKESDRSQTSGRSTFLDGSSLSTDSSVSEDSFCLDVDSNVRFSVWVSFCEIYNDNIHDLLEQVPSGQQRRTVLRLSQDVKGNSFIKDLRWVQASSSEEAYRVMKIGRKNQSCSSTRLNSLSSRSHSIFSIRILRIEDAGVPRILGISELSLCDLAGSERCSRTQNSGERLKEAGNINTSLLTLGKCISAMRVNQHTKVQHHVPFRESKLTHFLQFFFCGAGRVSMVVNISRNSACFDETLNVLKFSALAQKVVLLSSRPLPVDGAPHRSALEVSLIMDEAEQRRTKRKSSMVAWETSLEDLMEDGGEEEDEEEEEEEEEESPMEGTVLEAEDEEEEESPMEGTVLEAEAEEEEGKGTIFYSNGDSEAALRFLLEARIREEVSSEFMELYNTMKKDYSERLEKEKELLEERADKRVEILKKLVSKTASADKKADMLETEDLEKIREDAHTAELEALRLENQRSHDQLQERVLELMELSEQKDDVINKLQSAMEDQRNRALMVEEEQRRKRQREEEEERGPAKKRVLEEEIWRLQEENERQEETIRELGERRRGREEEEELKRREEELQEMKRREEELQEMKRREEELQEMKRREEELQEMKKEQILLQQKVQELTDLDSCANCDSVFFSLEAEQRESGRLKKENKALINGIFNLQTEVTSLQTKLKEQTDSQSEELNTAKARFQDLESQSEELNTAKARLRDLESQSEEKAVSYNSLTQEVERLRQEVKEEEPSRRFLSALQDLKEEGQAALQRSAEKSQLIQDLQEETSQLQRRLDHSENRCAELSEELSNQRAAFSQQLQGLRAELESERGALRGRLQEEEQERAELLRAALEKEKLLEECRRETETLRKELERLKEELQSREEEEEEEKEEENRQEEEEENRQEVMPVVQELKEELQKLKERREEREEKERREREEREFDAVRREVERLQRLKEERGGAQDVCVSPLRSNMIDRKKTTGRKRKSCENLVSSENKRNRGNTRTNKQSSAVKEKCDGALQKIGDLIHSSPSILGSTAKSIMGLVSGHSVEKEAVQRPKRGRRKLFKMDTTLQESPDAMSGRANEEKESDHLIIKRQLRSKTCRK